MRSPGSRWRPPALRIALPGRRRPECRRPTAHARTRHRACRHGTRSPHTGDTARPAAPGNRPSHRPYRHTAPRPASAVPTAHHKPVIPANDQPGPQTPLEPHHTQTPQPLRPWVATRSGQTWPGGSGCVCRPVAQAPRRPLPGGPAQNGRAGFAPRPGSARRAGWDFAPAQTPSAEPPRIWPCFQARPHRP